jgi:DNA-binding CsgD family transcriptional regulator
MPRKPLDKLIDQIYDAAVEPQLWNRVLIEIADMLSSASGVLCCYADQSLQSGFHYFGRLDYEFNERHGFPIMSENPWPPAVLRQPVGQIVASDAILPLAESRRTSWYREVITPQDVEHALLMHLDAANRIKGILAVQRSVRKGSCTKEEAKALEPLVPHLRRALRIQAHLHAYQTLARDQQELLDLLNIGIVVIDEFGTARCVNPAAQEMVAKGEGLTLRNATVSASEHSAAAELARLIAATASGGTGGALALQRQDSAVPLMVLVCPLRGTIRNKIGRLGEPRPAVALFIKDPALGDEAQLNDMLMQFYRLTPAETRVATTLAAGCGTTSTSRHLAVSKNTVKTHAKRIYEKMGLKSQGDLARLFGRLAVPVARRVSSLWFLLSAAASAPGACAFGEVVDGIFSSVIV